MKRASVPPGLNLALSLLALVTSAGAIVLHLTDRPEATPSTPGSVDAPSERPTVALGEGTGSIADVTARCLPSVVNVSTTRLVREQGGDGPFFDVFRHFFGLGEPAPHEAQSLGSGVIVSADGVVLTNHHVIADATEIHVTLSDGRDFAANVVGSDPESDVAVLRIDGDLELAPLPYGDSTALRQGDVVLAIGNPFGVGQTVTMGIVSAIGRASMGITDYEDFIQTDAAINPGNSGGALVNMRGELVGINTAILSRTGGSHGIGFAIPSNMARPIAEALLHDGRVTRGWLGASLGDLSPELARAMGIADDESGVVVVDVVPESPAASADLSRGDIVTRLDAEAIHSARQLRNLIATRGAGATIRITRERRGRPAEVRVTLAERPEAALGTPGTPGNTPDLAAARGATDVGGLLVQPLDRARRSEYGIAADVREGAVIVGMRDGSPGASIGVQPGEVVVEINGDRVTSPTQLADAYARSVFVALLGVRRGVETRLVMMRR